MTFGLVTGNEKQTVPQLVEEIVRYGHRRKQNGPQNNPNNEQQQRHLEDQAKRDVYGPFRGRGNDIRGHGNQPFCRWPLMPSGPIAGRSLSKSSENFRIIGSRVKRCYIQTLTIGKYMYWTPTCEIVDPSL